MRCTWFLAVYFPLVFPVGQKQLWFSHDERRRRYSTWRDAYPLRKYNRPRSKTPNEDIRQVVTRLIYNLKIKARFVSSGRRAFPAKGTHARAIIFSWCLMITMPLVSATICCITSLCLPIPRSSCVYEM